MGNKFYIGLAGKVIEVNALNDFTKEMCKEYVMDAGLVKSGPDFSIEINQKDIDFERNKADKEYPDDYLESLAVYRKICDKLADCGIILMHGSAISVERDKEQKGVIFIAPSGTGKSTHAKFWKEYLGDRVQYINDDKPLIDSNSMQIYGTPWDGKHRLSTNIGVKLSAICILERGEENSTTKISANEATGILIQQTYRPNTNETVSLVLESLNKIASNVECYRIKCRPELASAKLAYLEIFGEFIYKAEGTSMLPLIKSNSDLLRIKKRPYNNDGSFAPLRKNDVVLYKRGDENVLHRIAGVFGKGDGRNYITYGDNNRRLEYGIRDEQIIGVLDKVIRNGEEINPRSMKYTSTILWILRKIF